MTIRDELQTALGPAYLLERELGGGGMSRVFIAEEVRLKRRVVVKVLSPEVAQSFSAERFEREIHLAAGLQHPCIVPVLTAGESNGLAWYTMPYVEGESLRAKLVAANGPLSVNEAVRVLRDVAGALAFAHERGIVHRDIKPENVLLSGDYALVTDFGIAKALSAARTNPTADAEGLTGVGSSIGTPKYMAPEQAAGDPDTDHRADIYAWGIMAYELLTGATPFQGRALHQIVTAHLTEAPVPIREKRADIPPALADLVMRALEKNPAHRPQRARELVAALDTVSTPSAIASPTAAPPFSSTRFAKTAGFFTLVMAVAVGVMFSRRSTAAASDASIAVLPFVNMSGDPKNEYFSDGMTEELIDALARTGGMRVAARTSSFAFKGKTEDVKAIGKALGVGSVLEGSVRQAGDRVRITAQLIDANTGYHRWSETYDRELKDVFAVQDEISKAIVSALSVQMSSRGGGALVEAATDDPVAHDLYLKARYEWNKRSAEGLTAALDLFRATVDRDPKYARAWAGIAATYAILPQYTTASSDTTVPRARDAAMRAIQLDSMNAEAHAARAMIAFNYQFDWATADREFRAAIRADSSYATAHHWYSHLLMSQALLDSSAAEAMRAIRSDPLSPIVNISGAGMLSILGRYDEARDILAKPLQMSPGLRLLARGILGENEMRQGKFVEAERDLAEANPPGAWGEVFKGDHAYALAKLGRTADARQLVAEIENGKGPHGPIALGAALGHVGLGQLDSAVTWLERAPQQPGLTLFLNLLASDPLLDPVRSHPRFQALLKRMNLPVRAGR